MRASDLCVNVLAEPESDACHLRQQAFPHEYDTEITDSWDGRSLHMMIRNPIGILAAYGRITPGGGVFRASLGTERSASDIPLGSHVADLGRYADSETMRGQGILKMLNQECLQLAAERGFQLAIGAHVVNAGYSHVFYESGFEKLGPPVSAVARDGTRVCLQLMLAHLNSITR